MSISKAIYQTVLQVRSLQLILQGITKRELSFATNQKKTHDINLVHTRWSKILGALFRKNL